ncbi:MAG: glycosyltransferase family 2 protein [Candidatus Pacebacteria bacterium]|nr:glycosyltransferase family 2 protein [Candidatus Paceibacterota bacterium]
MTKLITIIIVNYNSADFINLTLEALANLTVNSYKVIILDNNSRFNDYSKLKKYTEKYKNISLERQKTNLKGSLAHGTALNYLINKVETNYFCIMDADAVWLKKGWDSILLKEFNDKVKAVGTQADSPNKPLDFPLMFAIMLETSTFKKLDIDMRPGNINIYQDTGYEMREKFLQAGFSGKIIEYKNTREYKGGPLKNIPAVVEYYLDGVLLASHFGRGSNPGGKKVSKIDIPLIRNFANFFQWHIDKMQWIGICKKIIEEQK